MSKWNPEVFLDSQPHRSGQIIASAFYTEVPGKIKAAGDYVSEADFKAAYSKSNRSLGPQRILIHSKEMIHELQQITGAPDTQRTGLLAMVPPFKLLIHHRNDIETKLQGLKQASSLATNSLTSEEMKIRRLQCIHDFIKTDLANYIGLDLRIRNGDIDELSFEEIYHLFKPGDLVLATETSDSQVHMVLSVSGGRMLLSSTSEGMPNPHQPRGAHGRAGTWVDLRLSCLTMAWDGENIGPRHSIYTIPFFTGKMRVTDLELYPIQFHPDEYDLRQKLTSRGRKIIQCFGHKKYTGTSVIPHKSLEMFVDKRMIAKPPFGDDSSDDEDGMYSAFEMVRSDVYIDYKAVYTNLFSKTPPLSFLPRISGELQGLADTLDTLSNGKTWNCSDGEIESIRSESFLAMNRHLTKFDKPKANLKDDEARLILLPGQVPAFVFNSRNWGKSMPSVCASRA